MFMFDRQNQRKYVKGTNIILQDCSLLWHTLTKKRVRRMTPSSGTESMLFGFPQCERLPWLLWFIMQTRRLLLYRLTLAFSQTSISDLSANATLPSKRGRLLLFCSNLPAAAQGGWGRLPLPPHVSTIINSATVAPLCWCCKAVRDWNHSKAAPPAQNKVSVASVKRVISKC